MHIKKSRMPKTWPIPRKGKRKRFVAVPSHSKTKGITILYILRDMLKIAESRKEAKKIMFNGDVKINSVIRKDDTFPVQVFDTISLDKIKKYYKLVIVNKKFSLEEISEKESHQKIIKIIGKTTLSKKETQMNLEDGSNILSKEKFSVGDSVIFNSKDKKVEKVLPLKKGSKIEVISGKHAGKEGELTGFEELTRGKNYLIKLEDKTQVSLPFKTILVIG
jgi:small subunit ribosomal protein S4e